MPTIKFLRETLNFGDGLIRKLCAFKDVSIKGDLYSPEFRQHFKADGAVCSLKQNTEGNLWKRWDCRQGNKTGVFSCKSNKVRDS